MIVEIEIRKRVGKVTFQENSSDVALREISKKMGLNKFINLKLKPTLDELMISSREYFHK